MNKKTNTQIKNEVEEMGYILIDVNYNNHKYYIIYKDNKNYYYESTFSNLKTNFLRNSLPSKFHKSNTYSILNIKNWLLLNKPNFIVLDNIYISMKHKLTLKDNEGYYYSISLDNLLHAKLPSKFGNGNLYTIQNINLWCKLEQRPFYLISDNYKEAHINLKWKCLICGEEFESTWGHIFNNRGCGKCLTSIGETRIKTWLLNNNIDFELHKSYDDLLGVGNKRLSYDFYLPNYNLLIEYQGRQHEIINPCWNHTEEDLKKQIEHDRRKKEYAQNNNINLLEIWYRHLNKIESILEYNILYSPVKEVSNY